MPTIDLEVAHRGRKMLDPNANDVKTNRSEKHDELLEFAHSQSQDHRWTTCVKINTSALILATLLLLTALVPGVFGNTNDVVGADASVFCTSLCTVLTSC
jgi:hypothetical protein